MEQVAILSQMFDFSLVVTTDGKIVHSYSSNDTYKNSLENYQQISTFEEATFQQPLFHKIDIPNEKKTYLQRTWGHLDVLTYVIPEKANNLLIFGYNLINTQKELHTLEETLNTSTFIFKSEAMQAVKRKIKKAAISSATTLLLGESGVGKEMAAREIYQASQRKDKPFVAINCGALPESLIESELFGYTAGSFTGAQKLGKIGKFQEANQGILFLDEIGELALPMQVKLLRVLQERVVTPIGSSKEYPIDVQIIAATNKSLTKMVQEGTFREDLYYRLNIIPIVIPPLRDRAMEIPELIHHFTKIFNHKYNVDKYFSDKTIDFLCLQEWPGNVRELENFVERAIILSDENIISLKMAKTFLNASGTKKRQTNFTINTLMPLQEAQELIEEQLISMAMDKYNSLKLAANVLGISQPTMSRKYKKMREAAQKEEMLFGTREILENELNKRLRATAVVTSVSISTNLLEDALSHATDPKYLKPVEEQLTQIYTQEDGVQWGFIFVKNEQGQIINLIASEAFIIPIGAVYIGSEIIHETIAHAFNGIISVTPIYEDEFGEWKTCCAPLYNAAGQVIAVLGFDYSKDYVNNELIKLSESLNIALS